MGGSRSFLFVTLFVLAMWCCSSGNNENNDGFSVSYVSAVDASTDETQHIVESKIRSSVSAYAAEVETCEVTLEEKAEVVAPEHLVADRATVVVTESDAKSWVVPSVAPLAGASHVKSPHLASVEDRIRERDQIYERVVGWARRAANGIQCKLFDQRTGQLDNAVYLLDSAAQCLNMSRVDASGSRGEAVICPLRQIDALLRLEECSDETADEPPAAAYLDQRGLAAQGEDSAAYPDASKLRSFGVVDTEALAQLSRGEQESATVILYRDSKGGDATLVIVEDSRDTRECTMTCLRTFRLYALAERAT